MDAFIHVFPHEKSVILNVLYDTLETGKFRIEQADCKSGTIFALSTEPPKRSIKIALNHIPNEKGTTVSIVPEIADAIGQQLSAKLFDEMSTTIQRTLVKYEINTNIKYLI